MKNFLRSIDKTLQVYGFDGRKFLRAVKSRRKSWFYKDLETLKQQKGADDTFMLVMLFPILGDKSAKGGVMKGQYFHQDLYVARQIFIANPQKHLDIGSRIDGFVAHVASFRPTELIDIRPVESKIKNITFRKADLMKLPMDLIESYDSISSLHALEHFGLGRYGDPIDYFGHIKAIENIVRMLATGGTFYFSVPIGPQRIEFNAHRVFSIKYLLETLNPKFTINSFSYVDDLGDFHENWELTPDSIASECNCKFGCGIFILTKR